MKKLLALLIWLPLLSLFLNFWYVGAQEQPKTSGSQNCWWSCEDWIKLNTCFPIIWDCIKTGKVNAIQAFPTMIWALTKIAMTLILIVCFIVVIYAGIKWAWAWDNNSAAQEAKKLLIKVGITVLLLWFSWVILRLINPNFFG